MNSVIRSLNIVAILTKTKIENKCFCQKNYIFTLHMQEATYKANAAKEVAKIYIKMMFKIW